jgi:hypothetical protein
MPWSSCHARVHVVVAKNFTLLFHGSQELLDAVNKEIPETIEKFMCVLESLVSHLALGHVKIGG